MSINNFGIVESPPITGQGVLFRSAQPDEKGFKDLRSLGVNIIYKLNSESEFPSAREVTFIGSGATVNAIEINQWFPDVTAVTRLVYSIKAARMGNNVLVHCTHGRDRTGLVIGAYRILVNSWTPEQALAEFSGYGAVGLIRLADTEIIELLMHIKP